MPEPIEFDFFWRLAKPEFAALIAFAVIGTIAWRVYQRPRQWQDRKRTERYAKRLGFVAELLVTAGVIGLLTFVGRARIASETVDREAQWVEAQRQVAAAIWRYAQPLCLNPPATLAPTQERAAQATACELWSKYINTANKDIYWRGAYDDYTALLNVPALSATLRAQLQQVQQSILHLIRTQYDKDVLPLKQKVLTAQSSWWFVLACASCAVLGIALKWAKAALDAFPHHQP